MPAELPDGLTPRPRFRPARTRATCSWPAARGHGRHAAARAPWWARRACGDARRAPAGAARSRRPSRSAATWTRGCASSRRAATTRSCWRGAGLERLGLTLAARAAPRSRRVRARGRAGDPRRRGARGRSEHARDILAALDDTATRLAALAERAFLQRLGAGCHTPVAAHARLERRRPRADGARGQPRRPARCSGPRRAGPAADASALGAKLAERAARPGRGEAPLLEPRRRAVGHERPFTSRRARGPRSSPAGSRAGGRGDPRRGAGPGASRTLLEAAGRARRARARPSSSSRRRFVGAARRARSLETALPWVDLHAASTGWRWCDRRLGRAGSGAGGDARAGAWRRSARPPRDALAEHWGCAPRWCRTSTCAEGLIERLRGLIRPGDRVLLPRAAADPRRARARAEAPGRQRRRGRRLPHAPRRGRHRPACARPSRRGESTS